MPAQFREPRSAWRRSRIAVREFISYDTYAQDSTDMSTHPRAGVNGRDLVRLLEDGVPEPPKVGEGARWGRPRTGW